MITITEKNRNNLAVFMPAKFRATIARQTRYSESMVSKVWRQGAANPKIVKAIFRLAAKTKAEREKENQKIKQIIHTISL